MKSLLRVVLFSICMMGMTTGTVFGWAWGTHAFIVDSLGQERLPAKSNEIYGSVALDTFNFLFYAPELLDALASAAHTGAEDVWDQARNQPEREFAFGFASHNELWGADMTAHQQGLTFGGSGQGYVIAKADVLLGPYGLENILEGLGLPSDARNLIAHVLVESAVDLMLAQQFPDLGVKLERAALHRNQLFPKMLVAAFSDDAPEGWDSEIKNVILETEEGFRGDIITYGQILQQPPDVAQLMMAALLVEQAKGYLTMFPSPPVLDTATLQYYANVGLGLAKIVCADYMTELDATKVYVADALEYYEIQD